jgi:hypothetical protein
MIFGHVALAFVPRDSKGPLRDRTLFRSERRLHCCFMRVIVLFMHILLIKLVTATMIEHRMIDGLGTGNQQRLLQNWI